MKQRWTKGENVFPFTYHPANSNSSALCRVSLHASPDDAQDRPQGKTQILSKIWLNNFATVSDMCFLISGMTFFYIPVKG